MPFDIGGVILNTNRAYTAIASAVTQSGLVMHLNAGINMSYP